MEHMEPEYLADVFASAHTQVNKQDQQTGRSFGPPPESYESLRRGASLRRPSGAYHYTIDGWDIIELSDGQTVKMFAPSLTAGKLRLPIDAGNAIEPVHPQLRYIMAFEVDPNEEANALLDLPITNRYVVYAVLLTDDDRYVPIGAEHVGIAPDQGTSVELGELGFKIGSALSSELDRTNLRQAPELPHAAVAAIDRFQSTSLSNYEQQDLVDTLMRLDDWAFWEAISRMLPYAKAEDKSWIAFHPQLAERAHDIKEANKRTLPNNMYDSNAGSLRLGTWKTAWMLPYPYDPRITYVALRGQTTDEPLAIPDHQSM
jgi:hypothetical protein